MKSETRKRPSFRLLMWMRDGKFSRALAPQAVLGEVAGSRRAGGVEAWSRDGESRKAKWPAAQLDCCFLRWLHSSALGARRLNPMA